MTHHCLCFPCCLLCMHACKVEDCRDLMVITFNSIGCFLKDVHFHSINSADQKHGRAFYLLVISSFSFFSSFFMLSQRFLFYCFFFEAVMKGTVFPDSFFYHLYIGRWLNLCINFLCCYFPESVYQVYMFISGVFRVLWNYIICK